MHRLSIMVVITLCVGVWVHIRGSKKSLICKIYCSSAQCTCAAAPHNDDTNPTMLSVEECNDILPGYQTIFTWKIGSHFHIS